MTKQSFAKTVSKVVAVVGGIVSGGLTFVTLRSQSNRLMKHLRELPPPNVDAEAYLLAVKRADEMAPTRTESFAVAIGDVGSKITETASTVADSFRSVDDGATGLSDPSDALTKVRNFGGAIAQIAGSVGHAATSWFKKKNS